MQNGSGSLSQVGPVLTLGGGNFANTQVNFASNNANGVPSIVAGNTLALGNTTTLSGGILQLMPTPGTATMSGFGGNYGVAYAGGIGVPQVSNGWTVNSNGPGTDNGTGTTDRGLPHVGRRATILIDQFTIFSRQSTCCA